MISHRIKMHTNNVARFKLKFPPLFSKVFFTTINMVANTTKRSKSPSEHTNHCQNGTQQRSQRYCLLLLYSRESIPECYNPPLGFIELCAATMQLLAKGQYSCGIQYKSINFYRSLCFKYCIVYRSWNIKQNFIIQKVISVCFICYRYEFQPLFSKRPETT